MRHYHLVVGQLNGLPLFNYVFDMYEDSISTMMAVASELYKYEDDETFTIENLVELTENGDGAAAYVGVPGMTITWYKCDVKCNKANWN